MDAKIDLLYDARPVKVDAMAFPPSGHQPNGWITLRFWQHRDKPCSLAELCLTPTQAIQARDALLSILPIEIPTDSTAIPVSNAEAPEDIDGATAPAASREEV